MQALNSSSLNDLSKMILKKSKENKILIFKYLGICLYFIPISNAYYITMSISNF